MRSETHKTPKTRSTKSLSHSKKAVEALQRNNPSKVPKRLLHMWKVGPFRLELAYGASLAKGQSWRISEIRHKGITTTVLQLQHKSRGKRRSVLQEDDRGAWPGLRGRPRARQTNHRQSPRPLLTSHKKL